MSVSTSTKNPYDPEPSRLIYVGSETYSVYNITSRLVLLKIFNFLPDSPNYCEFKFVQKPYKEFLNESPSLVPTPYCVGGKKNYYYFVVYYPTLYPDTGAPDSFEQLLYHISHNQEKTYGCYILGSDPYQWVITSQITSPYDVSQKEVIGIIPTHPIDTGINVQGGGGGSSDSPLLSSLIKKKSISDFLQFPCYVFPDYILNVGISIPEFVRYSIKRMITEDPTNDVYKYVISGVSNCMYYESPTSSQEIFSPTPTPVGAVPLSLKKFIVDVYCKQYNTYIDIDSIPDNLQVLEFQYDSHKIFLSPMIGFYNWAFTSPSLFSPTIYSNDAIVYYTLPSISTSPIYKWNNISFIDATGHTSDTVNIGGTDYVIGNILSDNDSFRLIIQDQLYGATPYTNEYTQTFLFEMFVNGYFYSQTQNSLLRGNSESDFSHIFRTPTNIFLTHSYSTISPGSLVIVFPESLESPSGYQIAPGLFAQFSTNPTSNYNILKCIFAYNILKLSYTLSPSMNIYLYVDPGTQGTSMYYNSQDGNRMYIECWGLNDTSRQISFSLESINNTLKQVHKSEEDVQFYNHFLMWDNSVDLELICTPPPQRVNGVFSAPYQYPDYIYTSVVVVGYEPQTIPQGTYLLAYELSPDALQSFLKLNPTLAVENYKLSSPGGSYSWTPPPYQYAFPILVNGIFDSLYIQNFGDMGISGWDKTNLFQIQKIFYNEVCVMDVSSIHTISTITNVPLQDIYNNMTTLSIHPSAQPLYERSLDSQYRFGDDVPIFRPSWIFESSTSFSYQSTLDLSSGPSDPVIFMCTYSQPFLNVSNDLKNSNEIQQNTAYSRHKTVVKFFTNMKTFQIQKKICNKYTLDGSTYPPPSYNSIYIYVSGKLSVYTPVIQQALLPKKILTLVQEKFGNTGVQSTKYNSGKLFLNSSIIADLNTLILDTYRQAPLTTGFSCVDMALTPFLYFHPYKFYDGFISLTPTVQTYNDLSNYFSGQNVLANRMVGIDIHFMQVKSYVCEFYPYKFYIWIKYTHSKTSQIFSCMGEVQEISSPGVEYKLSISNYPTLRTIDSTDSNQYKNFMFIVVTISHMVIPDINLVNFSMNTATKYIVTCLCGDGSEGRYFIINDETQKEVSLDTLNNTVIPGCSLSGSIHQYKNVSKISYLG